MLITNIVIGTFKNASLLNEHRNKKVALYFISPNFALSVDTFVGL